MIAVGDGSNSMIGNARRGRRVGMRADDLRRRDFIWAILSLPRPTRGEADVRPRAAGEGPNVPKMPNVRRARQSRRTEIPHPNPLPPGGEGIGIRIAGPALEATLPRRRIWPRALRPSPRLFRWRLSGATAGASRA